MPFFMLNNCYVLIFNEKQKIFPTVCQDLVLRKDEPLNWVVTYSKSVIFEDWSVTWQSLYLHGNSMLIHILCD